MKLYKLCFILCASLLPLTVCVDESRSDATPKLSHIDFDREKPEQAATTITPAAALQTPRAMLKNNAQTKLDMVNTLLVPSAKGVEANPGQEHVITSAMSWRPMFSNSCQLMRGAPHACDQARALREVLRRFTGSDDFYDTQCEASCVRPSQMAVLKSIKFTDERVISLEAKMSQTMCRYELARAPAGRWLTRQIKSHECVCVERACMN